MPFSIYPCTALDMLSPTSCNQTLPEKFVETLKLMEHRYGAKDFGDEQRLEPAAARHVLPHQGRLHVPEVLFPEAGRGNMQRQNQVLQRLRKWPLVVPVP